MQEKKIVTVLRLINALSGPSYYTVEELAEKFGVRPRTIYRYFDELSLAGFVIDRNRSRQFRIIWQAPQLTNLENLVFFSQEEAQLLGTLIGSLDTTNALRGSLYHKLASIYEVADMENFVVDKSAAENISILGNAMREKRTVILHDYESPNSGTIRDRHVEPFRFTTNYIDVIAYDRESGENKIFKVSRIRTVEMSDSWECEKQHRIGSFDVFRMHTFDVQTPVTLRLSLRAKNLLCEEFPLAQRNLSLEDGCWWLRTAVSGMEGVGRFCLGLYKEVDVVDSPELAVYLDRYIGDILRKKPAV